MKENEEIIRKTKGKYSVRLIIKELLYLFFHYVFYRSTFPLWQSLISKQRFGKSNLMKERLIDASCKKFVRSVII